MENTIFQGKTQRANADELGVIGAGKCGLDYIRREEPNHTKYKPETCRCDCRGCPECGRKLWGRYINHFAEFFDGEAIRLNMTRNVSNENMRRFIRRLKKLDGGILFLYAVEKKPFSHVHGLVKTTLSVRTIRNEWEAISGNKINSFGLVDDCRGWIAYCTKQAFNRDGQGEKIYARDLAEIKCNREIGYNSKSAIRRRREWWIMNDPHIHAEIERLTSVTGE